jgi:hypothetical protein
MEPSKTDIKAALDAVLNPKSVTGDAALDVPDDDEALAIAAVAAEEGAGPDGVGLDAVGLDDVPAEDDGEVSSGWSEESEIDLDKPRAGKSLIRPY